MEPIAQPGEYILMYFGRQWLLYQVLYEEPFWYSQQFTVDLSNGAGMAAQTILQNISTQNQLDQADGEMGQFRMSILDDIQVVFKNPQANTYAVDRNSTANFDRFTQRRDRSGHLTEFFVSQQNRPYLTVTNPTQYTIPFARVAFEGIRYVLSGSGGSTQGQSGAIQAPIQSFPQGINQALAWGQQNNLKFVVVPVQGWAGG